MGDITRKNRVETRKLDGNVRSLSLSPTLFALPLFSLTKLELSPWFWDKRGMIPRLAWSKAAQGLPYPCLGSQRKEIFILSQHPHLKHNSDCSTLGNFIHTHTHTPLYIYIYLFILRPITLAKDTMLTRPESWDYS